MADAARGWAWPQGAPVILLGVSQRQATDLIH